MGMMQLLMTAGVVGGIWYIMRSDIRPGLRNASRNLQHLKNWWDEGAKEAKEDAERDIKKIPEDKSRKSS